MALQGKPVTMTETQGATRISIQDLEPTAAFALVLLRPDSVSCPNRLLHQICTG